MHINGIAVTKLEMLRKFCEENDLPFMSQTYAGEWVLHTGMYSADGAEGEDLVEENYILDASE